MKMIKISISAFLVGIILLPVFLLANETDRSDGVTEVQTEFYFPEYDSTVDDFWVGQETFVHRCQATSWIGHTASASCEDTQACECSSNFLFATCECKSMHAVLESP